MFKAGAEIREERMDFDLANAATKGHVVLGSEVGGVDYQNLVLDQSRVHIIKGFVVEIRGEIKTGDLGTKRRGESADLHAAMLTLFRPTRRFAAPAAGWRPLILGDWFHDKSV